MNSHFPARPDVITSGIYRSKASHRGTICLKYALRHSKSDLIGAIDELIRAKNALIHIKNALIRDKNALIFRKYECIFWKYDLIFGVNEVTLGQFKSQKAL